MLLIDQLKRIYIDGELNAIDTAQWYPDRDAQGLRGRAERHRERLDDPDQQFYENYSCGAERNYTGYCNPEVDKLVDQQSTETDVEKRQKLVWEIDRKLAEDGARPMIFHGRGGPAGSPTSRAHDDGQRQLQRLALEDAWLDK